MKKAIALFFVAALSGPLLFSPCRAAGAERGIVASWTFDSVSGNIFYDVTGHGYDAFGSGDSIRISPDGISGKALECSGPKGGLNTFDIEIKKSLPDFNLQKVTIEAWVYLYVNNPISADTHRSIFQFVSCGMEGSGITGGYGLRIFGNGKPMFSWSDFNSKNWCHTKLDSAPVLLPNRWYHLAATFDSAAAKLYVNGVLRAIKPDPLAYFPSGKTARIGCLYQTIDSGSGYTKQFFNGKIDELKLYDFVLDSPAIRRHYEADKPPFRINFGMKPVYCAAGEMTWVPIHMTNYASIPFNSCRFTIRFDTAKLQLLSLSRDSGLIKKWELFEGIPFTAADSVTVTAGSISDTITFGEGEFLRCFYHVKPAAALGNTCSIWLTGIEINDSPDFVGLGSLPGKIVLEKPPVLFGNVTGDGQVTESDARDIFSYAIGHFSLPDPVDHPSFTITAADVTGNGVVTSYDAALVFQYSLGLLPGFPAEDECAPYAARSGGAAECSAGATLAITLASQSDAVGMQFNLSGANIRGFSAGEFNVAYNSAIANIGNCLVNTALPATILYSRIVPSKHFITIALATKCTVYSNDPVVFATITLPPKSTADPTNAFSLATALINEGKISTNIPAGPISGALDGTSAHAAAAGSPYIRYRSGMLHLATGSNHPIRVRIFSLTGRCIENRVFQPESIVPIKIPMNDYPRGAYVYSIVLGPGENMTGRIIVKD